MQIMDNKKEPYLRYERPASDPAGTFRGDATSLYEGTMSLIHEQALIENERRKSL